MSDPFPLYHWARPILERIEAFGLSPDGSRLAIGSPHAPDRVDIWTMDGKCQFGFYPLRGRVVEWLDFSTDGRLLVSAGGEISAWELGPDAVKAVYETTGGGYAPPFALLPGREWIVAGRGGAFDVLDARTGQVQNRFGIGAEGIVMDIAISPDGKHIAALYGPAALSWVLGGHRLQRNGTYTYEATLAVWDLATGEARQADAKFTDYGLLAWASPEHLVFCSPTSRLFDLRLDAESLAYQIDRSHTTSYDYSFPFAPSPDGRVWAVHPAPRTELDPLDWTIGRYPANSGRSEANETWKATIRAEPEAPFFAADRVILALEQTPIRLELDVGSRRLGKTHGERLLLELRGRGIPIGADGLVLRVAPRVVATTDKLKDSRGKSEGIPAVDYHWELRDAQDRLVWTHTTTGKFLGSQSKYFTGSSSTQTNYDFGDKPVETAIVEEILERGAGLALPIELPKLFLFGAGKYVTFPQESTWSSEASS